MINVKYQCNLLKKCVHQKKILNSIMQQICALSLSLGTDAT